MRKEGLAALVAILVVAGLGIGYLAESTATRTATSSATSASPFTYQTVTSSTVFSSNSTTFLNGTTITETITSVSTSTLIATWSQGQPIPGAMVETDNFSIPSGPFVLNPTTDRIYVLGTSSLTVVDASSHLVVATVPLPENNTGGSLTIDTSTDIVYAAVQGEVLEVNGSTNTVVRGLPLSLGNLAFDPATGMLWGTELSHSGVVEVNVRTGSVVANISVAFDPLAITLDPKTGLVYADGCTFPPLVCIPGEAIIDGASGAIVATVQLGGPSMALDPATHVVYVSGEQAFAAFNGITGKAIFGLDPQTCGPFTDMVVDPSANLVYMVPDNYYNYLLAYDGATGKLANMYVFENPIDQVAFNPSTSELYVDTAGQLIALRPLSSTGNVNATLIGEGRGCGVP